MRTLKTLLSLLLLASIAYKATAYYQYRMAAAAAPPQVKTVKARSGELRITLPKQLRGRAGLARVTKLLAGGKGVRKPSLRLNGRTLTVKLPKSGTRSPDLRLAGGALRLAGKLTVGQRVTFAVTAIRVNGKKLSVRASARAQA